MFRVSQNPCPISCGSYSVYLFLEETHPYNPVCPKKAGSSIFMFLSEHLFSYKIQLKRKKFLGANNPFSDYFVRQPSFRLRA